MGVTPAMGYLVRKHLHGSLRDTLDAGLSDPDYDTALNGTIWLTEQSGGSDLGALETVAWQDENGTWRLRGLKVYLLLLVLF
jgi:acyl-CoA dehydrogenase